MPNLLDPGYYETDELHTFGFARVGDGVRIACNCTVIGPENIAIGDNVQIDSFTSIIADKGWLKLGSYIHICSGVLRGCRGGVELGNFTAASHDSKVLSASDDFSGD